MLFSITKHVRPILEYVDIIFDNIYQLNCIVQDKLEQVQLKAKISCHGADEEYPTICMITS